MTTTTARRRSYAHALMERALSDAIRHTRRQYPEEAAGRRAGLQALRKELRADMPTDLAPALDVLLEEHTYLAMDLQHVHMYGGEPELEGRLEGLSAIIEELEFAALEREGRPRCPSGHCWSVPPFGGETPNYY